MRKTWRVGGGELGTTTPSHMRDQILGAYARRCGQALCARLSLLSRCHPRRTHSQRACLSIYFLTDLSQHKTFDMHHTGDSHLQGCPPAVRGLSIPSCVRHGGCVTDFVPSLGTYQVAFCIPLPRARRVAPGPSNHPLTTAFNLA